MGDLLFVTWDGGGNLPPALGIARELQGRGHTVRFLGNPSQTERLRAAGVEVVPTRHTRRFDSTLPKSAAQFLVALGARGPARDLLAEIAVRPPDLLVIDAMSFAALDAARRTGLRYLVLEHCFDAYHQQGCLRGPLGLSLGLRGLAPRRAWAAAGARLVTTVPELDPSGSTGVGLTYVGPVVDIEPVAPRRSEDPLVLVSLSTCAFPGMRDVLQRVVDAVAPLARAVVTTGPALDPAQVRTPEGVEVHRYVPHAGLMAAASAVVGHGGHGTTMQALAHDLPLVVLPMERHTDQPLVGEALERAGAGRALPRRSSVTEIRGAVEAVLADGAHRSAAARLGAAVRARPGARLGADAVERSLMDPSRPTP